MQNLIRPTCGPLPLPEQGKNRKLTPQERRALVEFARKNTPPNVAELVSRAVWLQRKNPEWFLLLDEEQEQLGVEVHIELLNKLFDGAPPARP